MHPHHIPRHTNTSKPMDARPKGKPQAECRTPPAPLSFLTRTKPYTLQLNRKATTPEGLPACGVQHGALPRAWRSPAPARPPWPCQPPPAGILPLAPAAFLPPPVFVAMPALERGWQRRKEQARGGNQKPASGTQTGLAPVHLQCTCTRRMAGGGTNSRVRFHLSAFSLDALSLRARSS